MQTTLDIADDVLLAAKERTQREWPARAVVETPGRSFDSRRSIRMTSAGEQVLRYAQDDKRVSS